MSIFRVWAYSGYEHIQGMSIFRVWAHSGYEHIQGMSTFREWAYSGYEHIQGMSIFRVWAHSGYEHIQGMSIFRVWAHSGYEHIQGMSIFTPTAPDTTTPLRRQKESFLFSQCVQLITPFSAGVENEWKFNSTCPCAILVFPRTTLLFPYRSISNWTKYNQPGALNTYTLSSYICINVGLVGYTLFHYIRVKMCFKIIQ